jgi:hypothetical protein
MIWLRENPMEYLSKFVVFKGGGGGRAPQIDYGAIQRQQDQERARLQAIRDEEFRVSGVRDFINFQFDNPFQVTEKAASGRFFKAISPGRVPGDALSDYVNDKSITAKALKENTEKYFKSRVSIPSVKKGRIQFGKRADKPSTAGLLGSGDEDSTKALLGA